MSVAELARAAGGELVRGDAQARVTSYGIDSRRLAPGAAFFALAAEAALHQRGADATFAR